MCSQIQVVSNAEDCYTEGFRNNTIYKPTDLCIPAYQLILVHHKPGISIHEPDHLLALCFSVFTVRKIS